MKPSEIAREAILTHNALQKGGELASFYTLLQEIEPKIVVEIGSDAGGTLWAWQQLGCRVIGVTMKGGPFGSAAGTIAVNDHGCEIVYGDSHDDCTLANLEELLDGNPIDVLFIDGDHTFGGVRQDYLMYGPLVRDGGVVAFHDICDHPTVPSCKVRSFWHSLEGIRKEEIITDPPSWGGIGVIRVGSAVAA